MNDVAPTVPRSRVDATAAAIKRFEPAVRKLTNRHARWLPPHIRANESEDLAQEGRIGVLEAVHAHDPRRGALSTLAVPAIKWRVRDAIDALPCESMHADAVDTIDGHTADDGSEVTKRSFIASAAHQDASAIQAQVAAAVAGFVDQLEPQQRAVTRAVFWCNKSQADVARDLRVSRARITHILHEVYRRGRAMLAGLND